MKNIILKLLIGIFAAISLSTLTSTVHATAPNTITQPESFCTQVLGGTWNSGGSSSSSFKGECYTGRNCRFSGIPDANQLANCDSSTYAELKDKDVASVIKFLSASKGLPDGTLNRLSTYQPTASLSGENIDNLSGKCKDDLFFFIPTWYKYMPKKSTTPCQLAEIHHLSDLLPILIAVVEILTRLAIFLAVGFIIWGGVKFILSQGEPEGIANARNTIINAVIGLILTIMATALISFIGQRIS